VSTSSDRSAPGVIVVGSGAAALSAALAARAKGASVTVVEASDTLGGTTAVSGGGVWMPQNHHMAELESVDSRPEALAYMGRLTAGRTPVELLEHYVDRGPDILAHLERTTPLELRPMTWPDYHPEMEGAKSSGRMLEPALYDTNRLGRWAARLRRPPVLGLPISLQEATVEWRPSYTPEKFDAAAVQARVAAGPVAGGQALIGALLEACLAAGIEPGLETRAVEITMSGRGADERVAGLVVENDGVRAELPAAAVVLASGGYEWNALLRERFLPGPLTHPHSPPTNQGDGLAMAMAVGADLANMNETWWYPASSLPGDEYDGHPLARFVGVERTAPHSIMVNRFGQRFVNEAGNYNDLGKSFFSFDINEYTQRNLPSWVVFDRQYRSRYAVSTCRPGDPDPEWLIAHETLDGLAGRAGIDPVGLAETVERWNRFVAEGRERAVGRGSSA
jgi:3-oxosteroid 1-dehydrogenase